MVDAGRFLVHSLLAVATSSTVAICLTSIGLVALVSGVRCKRLESWKQTWRGSQSRVLRLLWLANLADPLAYAAVWRVAATHRCPPHCTAWHCRTGTRWRKVSALYCRATRPSPPCALVVLQPNCIPL